MQEILVICFVSAAAIVLLYKGYRFFFRKKESCNSCSFSPLNQEVKHD